MARNKKAGRGLSARLVKPAINISSPPSPQELPQQDEYYYSSPDTTGLANSEESEPELEEPPAKKVKNTPSTKVSAQKGLKEKELKEKELKEKELKDKKLKEKELKEKQSKEKAEKISWDFTMEEMLFQTLLDRARAGKRADQGFKTEAWVDALSKVKAVAPAKVKPLLTLAKIKSKESNYKALYKDWKWLIAQSGFGIHPETRVVTASAEAWDEVLQVSKFMSFY
jgi:Myb/SANT-like DNA-binding domain